MIGYLRSLSTLLGAVGLLLMGSCVVNPVTGERELSLVSTGQQIQIGTQQYAPGQQAQGGIYTLDPQLNSYVQSVGRKLAAVSQVPSLPYEFVVLNNPVPNAWALPGGKIAINRGLLTELQDEAQLAAVLAHEIVHAAAGHGASQMSRGMLIGLGTQIAGAATANTEYGQPVNLGSQLGAGAWMARYGRNDELEADQYGMDYMSRVGYDPYAAVELQRTFVRLSEGRQSDIISGLFASHPPSQQRVDANLAKARQLPAGGVTNKEAYQRAIAQLKRDQPAYEAEQKAIKALNEKNPNQALAYLDEAIRIQPNAAEFWQLRGHAWEMLNDQSKAEQAFTTAVTKNPSYFEHWLSRGLLRQKLGNITLAKSDLEKSYDLLPLAVTALHLGKIAEQSRQTDQAIQYYRTAASEQSSVGKEAQQKLAKLELSSAPGKYIAGGVLNDNTGKIVLVVRNDSPVTVKNLRVELLNRQTGEVKTYRFNGSLSAGRQQTQATGITGSAALFQLRVVAGEPE